MVKNLPANVGDSGDVGLMAVSGRSPGEGNGNPLQYFCKENSRDRGAWWATVHRVTKSWMQQSTHTRENQKRIVSMFKLIIISLVR